jgi:hypothetical protein
MSVCVAQSDDQVITFLLSTRFATVSAIHHLASHSTGGAIHTVQQIAGFAGPVFFMMELAEYLLYIYVHLLDFICHLSAFNFLPGMLQEISLFPSICFDIIMRHSMYVRHKQFLCQFLVPMRYMYM